MSGRSVRQDPGMVCLVLHAHLPFIRRPEHAHHLEERWLFEAVAETYLPLLDVFERLVDDGIDFRITLSISPTLIEMFRDRLLMERCSAYLSGCVELCRREIRRTRQDARFNALARMYHERFGEARKRFDGPLRRDIVAAFSALQQSGCLQVITTAATHAYLPAMISEPSSARAQISIGAGSYRAAFGRQAEGIWLPECGYARELEPMIDAEGMRFFFLETHGLLHARPRPRAGVYAPVLTPCGLYAFGRDPYSSRQVWSSQEGYPGDAAYREFHRDIGFDLDLDYLRPHLPEGVRTYTGIKYYRVTGRTGRKLPYDPGRAARRAREHAAHFVRCRAGQLGTAAEGLKITPVLTATYDAELFGHWWFEGPVWLDRVIRMASSGRRPPFRLITPSDYISEELPVECAQPSMSSWGDRGYSQTWVGPSNNWVYPHLIRASRLMNSMAQQKRHCRGRTRRALNQAARELLLAQASDWTFMMKTGHAAGFAANSFLTHMGDFMELHRQIISGRIDEGFLLRLENRDNLFRDLDFRRYAGEDISPAACRTDRT